MQDTLKGESQYPHFNEGYIKDRNKLESCLDNWDNEGMSSKLFYMRTWLQNINMHAGNQWLTYDEHKQIFELQPQLDDEIKLTMNKIMPAVRMAVGKMIKMRKK
jgi:RNA processing factor Prp31